MSDAPVNIETLKAMTAAARAGGPTLIDEAASFGALAYPRWAAEEVEARNARGGDPVDLGGSVLDKGVWAPPGKNCPFRTTPSDGASKLRPTIVKL